MRRVESAVVVLAATISPLATTPTATHCNPCLTPIAGSAALVSASGEGPKWDHNDIDAWNEIGDCAAPTNLYQSPLNFDTTQSYANSTDVLTIHYPTSIDAEVINNGHGSPQLVFGEGPHVELNGERYNLLQIHFHVPSEETIDGVAPAFDAHYVHQNPDSKALLVIGQLYNAGDQEFPLLTTAVENDPTDPSAEPKAVTGINLQATMPSEGTRTCSRFYVPSHVLPSLTQPPTHPPTFLSAFWTFQGSLTTPPCSGGLSWFVNSVPYSATAAQIEALKAVGIGQGLENGNARPTQPLNGRDVTVTYPTVEAA